MVTDQLCYMLDVTLICLPNCRYDNLLALRIYPRLSYWHILLQIQFKLVISPQYETPNLRSAKTQMSLKESDVQL